MAMTTNYGELLPDAALDSSATRIALDEGLALSWSHCGATAEFLGEIYGNLAGLAGFDRNDARHSINYLANELFENAVKFRLAGAGAITLEAALVEGVFNLRISNLAAAAHAERFQGLLTEITSRDSGDLLLERIEANALGQDGSGLGILTMMNDYGAKMGWRFEQEGEAVRIETHVALALA